MVMIKNQLVDYAFMPLKSWVAEKEKQQVLEKKKEVQ